MRCGAMGLYPFGGLAADCEEADLGTLGAGVVRGLARRSCVLAALSCWRVLAGWRGMIPRGIGSPVCRSCGTWFSIASLPSTTRAGLA